MRAPKRYALLSIATLTLTASGFLTSLAPAAPAKATDLTFVYIHGFGGKKEKPEFVENLREFLTGAGVDAEAINYEWDSVRVAPLKAGASWIKAQRRADAEAVSFKRDVIDRFERQGGRYVLVGFSVGSRVILRALESCEARLDGLAGVYFLGSAMTKDTTFRSQRWRPEGMKVINYHSPVHDQVHRMAFRFMSEIPAGGEVGFDDKELFENYAVSCTHAHKGVGVHIDYSRLAEAIAAIELFRHGVSLPGRTKFNIKTDVGDGDLWWNKILRVPAAIGGEQVQVEIEQHNMRAGYFRALRVDADGERRRVARGESLHAIFRDMGIRLDRQRG